MNPTRRQLLITGLALAVCPVPAVAAAIPYFEMDSLTQQSIAVVLMTEDAVRTERAAGGYDVAVVKGTVKRVFHGDLEVDATVEVELDPVYRRLRPADMWSDPPGEPLPLGEAVVFLASHDEATGRHVPVLGGVKPIVAGVAWRYGQFASNPGPLCVLPQEPERVEPEGSYDRAAFLADVEKQVAAGKKLRKPRPLYPPPQP